MQYSSPLPPPSIFLFSHLSVISFFFFFLFLPSLQSFLFFACLLSLSFPPLCSFSADVWRALQSRGDGDSSYPGQGPQCWWREVRLRRIGEGSLSGGWKDGYVSECWERRAPHWWIKDQVGCTWELWFSIAGGETGEPGHTLACVLFAAPSSQSPLLSCITNNQRDGRRG